MISLLPALLFLAAVPAVVASKEQASTGTVLTIVGAIIAASTQIILQWMTLKSSKQTNADRREVVQAAVDIKKTATEVTEKQDKIIGSTTDIHSKVDGQLSDIKKELATEREANKVLKDAYKEATDRNREFMLAMTSMLDMKKDISEIFKERLVSAGVASKGEPSKPPITEIPEIIHFNRNDPEEVNRILLMIQERRAQQAQPKTT